jgi:hypothetical protein
MSLRSRVKVQMWETRAWDAITIAVMLVTALVCAIWMIKS